SKRDWSSDVCSSDLLQSIEFDTKTLRLDVAFIEGVLDCTQHVLGVPVGVHDVLAVCRPPGHATIDPRGNGDRIFRSNDDPESPAEGRRHEVRVVLDVVHTGQYQSIKLFFCHDLSRMLETSLEFLSRKSGLYLFTIMLGKN